MIKTIILTVIILVVPVFFAALFLAGGYHNLSKLRSQCSGALSPSEHESAARAYEAERKRFPSCLAAVVFRFKPAAALETITGSPANSRADAHPPA